MSEMTDDIRKTSDDLTCISGLAGRADAIGAALMAERERCAKIAETLGVYPELNVFNGGPEWYRHGKEIANAIRTALKDTAHGQ